MELKDTLSMMVSDDYKERFKAEYAQLRIRLIKLEEVLTKYWDGRLGFELDCPVKLLEMQAKAMDDYLSLLSIRAEIEGIDLKPLFAMEHPVDFDTLKSLK